MPVENGTVAFLVPVRDLVTSATVYGQGHQANVNIPNVDINRLRNEGKIDLVSPDIRNVFVSARTTATAEITFTVDRTCTGMAIYYGLTSGTSSSVPATPASGTGIIVTTLSGLTTGTLYYYKILVYGAGLPSQTSVTTFTTL